MHVVDFIERLRDLPGSGKVQLAIEEDTFGVVRNASLTVNLDGAILAIPMDLVPASAKGSISYGIQP